jgi:tetratricopeptide (TPR) repeat protein
VKRAHRHELKQDEFVNWLDQTTQWFMQNQRNVVNVALVLVGAGLLLGGLYIYRGRQAARARALIVEALDQYHGQVGTGSDADAASPHFATAKEKYETSLASFEAVADEFSGYEAGRQALYYVGLCQAHLGDFEAAETSLGRVRSGSHDLLYYLASMALASVKNERGDPQAAAELYRALADDPDDPLPKDHILFQLARSEERAGNTEQARLYYQRIIAEHPDSQLRGDAMTRSEALALQSGSGVSGG